MRARFYLIKKLLDSEGAAPIYISIHHRSHRLRYYTGERIKQIDWCTDKQRAKSSYIGHLSLNDLLDALAEEPRTIERNARIAGIDCTVEYLKEQLSYNKSKPRDFLGVVDDFIKEESLRNSWSPSTQKNWRFFKNNLARFNKKYRLELDSVNDHFAQAFISDMIKLGWAHDLIKNHISMAIQFASWARRKGYHTSTAYRDIDVTIHTQEPEPQVDYLTIECSEASSNVVNYNILIYFISPSLVSTNTSTDLLTPFFNLLFNMSSSIEVIHFPGYLSYCLSFILVLVFLCLLCCYSSCIVSNYYTRICGISMLPTWT